MKKLFLILGMACIGQFCWSQQSTININNELKVNERHELEALLTDAMRYTTLEQYDRADSLLRRGLIKNPNLAAFNFELAKTLLKREKLDEAAIYSQKAYQISAENKFYGQQYAEILTQQRKYDKAADVYKAIIKLSADNIDYGFELANVYLQNEQYEEAIKAYNEIEKSEGVNESLSHQKQRIYIRLNKPDKAIEEARKLVGSDPTEAHYVVELARLLMATNKIEEAKVELEKATKINPDEADAQLLLVDIYKQKGDNGAATQQMGQMFNNPNADIDVKMQALAAMFYEAKDEAAKKEVLMRAQEIVKVHPKDTKAHVVYADLLTKANKKAEARNEYVKAAQLNPASFEVWGAILQLDTDLNQTDSLIAHSEKALELFPNQGLFWYSNGSAYLIKKNYEKAVESLEEAQKWSSKNKNLTVAVAAQLGDAYHGQGNNAKSDEAYETALKEDPNNDHVLNNYSYFLSLRKTKLDQAKAMAEKVVERNPDNPTYLDTYAWVLYMQKDYANAKIYSEKAVMTGKASATVTEHYGDALFKTGDKTKAIEQWNKAKQLGGNNTNLNKKIETQQLNEM